MKKSILILSMTPVTDEPRVRRQTESLEKLGWNIFVCGFKGRAKKPESWTLWNFYQRAKKIYELPSEDQDSDRPGLDEPEQARTGLKQSIKNWISTLPTPIRIVIGRFIALAVNRRSVPLLLLSRFSDKCALKYYWKNFYYQSLYEYLKNKIATTEGAKPDVIVAHDYFTAPMAKRLADDYGCRYVVDIHEYANGQYMHSRLWRLFVRPWVFRMQGMFLPASAFNTTVCDGIANLLAEEYAPMVKPTVIRSTPSYNEMPYRPVGEKISVMYHGIIYHTRGIDMALESLPRWRPEFTLTVRGPGSTDYIDYLNQKAKSLGVQDRFVVEPPVLFNQIVAEANKSDIGYFIHEDVSPQKRFTLPNKFFEYITAGVALCVSDLPEMAKIVKQYDLGRLVKGYDPETIAAAINAMDRNSINLYKQNTLKAARDLCWENECRNMIDRYTELADETAFRRLAS